MRPFSQACENNKAPILSVLEPVLSGARRVLEIGSGTGQHAVYFGANLTHLTWVPSDVPEHHAGIRAWLDEAGLDNVPPPLALDVNDPVWPIEHADGVFSANTVHIMDWASVMRMYEGIGRLLAPGGVLVLYGPFRFAHAYTSQSNEQFDRFLRARDPASGVRDFEALDRLASEQDLVFSQRHDLPANNQVLVWVREGQAPGQDRCR